MNNNVTNPSHYTTGEIEAKDALKAMLEGSKFPHIVDTWRSFAFKYIWRADKKNGLEDLYKAKQCIEYAIEELESTQAPKGVLTER